MFAVPFYSLSFFQQYSTIIDSIEDFEYSQINTEKSIFCDQTTNEKANCGGNTSQSAIENIPVMYPINIFIFFRPSAE
jgi:hypothetical protein